MTLNVLGCCGIAEVRRLESHASAEDALLTFGRQFILGSRCYAIFSHKESYKEGYKLLKLIKDSDIGEVVGLKTTLNPNSGNTIHAFMFAPDRDKLKTLVDELEKEEVEKRNAEVEALLGKTVEVGDNVVVEGMRVVGVGTYDSKKIVGIIGIVTKVEDNGTLNVTFLNKDKTIFSCSVTKESVLLSSRDLSTAK